MNLSSETVDVDLIIRAFSSQIFGEKLSSSQIQTSHGDINLLLTVFNDVWNLLDAGTCASHQSEAPIKARSSFQLSRFCGNISPESCLNVQHVLSTLIDVLIRSSYCIFSWNRKLHLCRKMVTVLSRSLKCELRFAFQNFCNPATPKVPCFGRTI